VPAAAVIPALLVYIKVAAVKKFVAELKGIANPNYVKTKFGSIYARKMKIRHRVHYSLFMSLGVN